MRFLPEFNRLTGPSCFVLRINIGGSYIGIFDAQDPLFFFFSHPFFRQTTHDQASIPVLWNDPMHAAADSVSTQATALLLEQSDPSTTIL